MGPAAPQRTSSAIFNVEAGLLVSATLNGSWTPSTPTASTIAVEFYCCSDQRVAQSIGGTPFSMELPVDQLARGGTFVALTRPIQGVFVDQVIAFNLTLTYAVRPD